VAKWLNEYDTDNRLQGDHIFLSFMMSLRKYGLSHPLTESKTEVSISRTKRLVIAALPISRDLG
jgi:hypothetical protein